MENKDNIAIFLALSYRQECVPLQDVSCLGVAISNEGRIILMYDRSIFREFYTLIIV